MNNTTIAPNAIQTMLNHYICLVSGLGIHQLVDQKIVFIQNMVTKSPTIINQQQTAHPAIKDMLSVKTLVTIAIAKNVPLAA